MPLTALERQKLLALKSGGGKSSGSIFDQRVMRDLFGVLGMTGGALAGAPLAPETLGTSSFLGAMGGATGMESLRQGLAGMTGGGPRSTTQQVTELARAAEAGGASELLGPVLGKVATVGAMPLIKANQIRKALVQYYKEDIQDFFRPLYESVTQHLKGRIPIGVLKDRLRDLLVRFNIFDSAGSLRMNESDLSPTAKKVLAIYRSLSGEGAGTFKRMTRKGADAAREGTTFTLESLRGTKAASSNPELFALQPTATDVEAQGLRDQILQLHQMGRESVLSGKELADADHALSTGAVHAIGEHLSPYVPELKSINDMYADRIGFFDSANELFRPLSKNRLDFGKGTELLGRIPKITPGEQEVLKAAEERLGIKIIAPMTTSAGIHQLGELAFPLAGLAGGAALGVPGMGITGRGLGMFGGWFIGRRFASAGQGIGRIVSGLSAPLTEAVENRLPGVMETVGEIGKRTVPLELSRLGSKDQDERTDATNRLLLHGLLGHRP